MSTKSTLRTKKIDIAVIGAGPQALTLVAHILQKRKKYRSKLTVFDPTGTWMSQWQHQFAALKIEHLRSPAVHHPDPDPYSLRRFAENRPNELFPPYDLPGTRLFEDFCREAIARWQLEKMVYKASAMGISPVVDGNPYKFRIKLDDGSETLARRVVLASGGGKPQIPDWVSKIPTPFPKTKLCHSHQVDLRCEQLRGETVLIIGGGLTSAHLAVGAIERGAKVLLMMRSSLQEKLFDAEPGWLGPKYLKGFEAEPDWQKRWQLIQQARGGGSITPELGTKLRRLQRDGKLSLYQECQIIEARFVSGVWQVRCQDKRKSETDELTADRIWLATGTKLDVREQPLLKEVLDAYPVETVNGLPVLDENLRWPGCELFIMGGLAALQVGPVARNLSGGRMASVRVCRRLFA